VQKKPKGLIVVAMSCQTSYLLSVFSLEVLIGDILPFLLLYVIFLSGFSAGAPGWFYLPLRKYN